MIFDLYCCSGNRKPHCAPPGGTGEGGGGARAAYLLGFLEGFQGVDPAGHRPLVIGGASPVQFAWNSSQHGHWVMVTGRRGDQCGEQGEMRVASGCPGQGGEQGATGSGWEGMRGGVGGEQWGPGPQLWTRQQVHRGDHVSCDDLTAPAPPGRLQQKLNMSQGKVSIKDSLDSAQGDKVHMRGLLHRAKGHVPCGKVNVQR